MNEYIAHVAEDLVAPRVGAWIETLANLKKIESGFGRALRGRGPSLIA